MKILGCNANTRLRVNILGRVCLHQNTAATVRLYTVPHRSGIGLGRAAGSGDLRVGPSGDWGKRGGGFGPGEAREVANISFHCSVSTGSISLALT